MIGLTRHFRDKDDEYLEFEITTTSASQSVYCRLGITPEVMSSLSKHRVDWGDGSPMDPVDASTSPVHVYGSTGSYTVRVWTREKYQCIDEYWNSLPLTGPLDFSQWEYIYYMVLPGSTWTGTFSMPTQYKGNSPMTLQAIGSNGVLSDPDGIVDLSLWSKYSIIFLFGGSFAPTVKRIVTNPSNGTTLNQGFRCYSTSLEAIGPSAANLSNRTADLTGLNMNGDLVLQASNSGNAFNEIIMPSSAFSSSGVDQVQIVGASISSIDMSQVIWEEADNAKNISIYNNPQLSSVTHPPYGITGSFNNIRFDGSQLSTLDLSSYELFTSSTVRINGAPITSMIFATSSTTTLILLYGIGTSLSSAPNFTDIPNATEINSSNINLSSGSLDAASVNKVLVDLDTNSTGGFTGRFINLSGNTAPDGTSGGLDGLTAKSNLITKGFSVTTD